VPIPENEGELIAPELAEGALLSTDEHAIKLVEVALESQARGTRGALAAAHRAVDLLSPQ